MLINKLHDIFSNARTGRYRIANTQLRNLKQKMNANFLTNGNPFATVFFRMHWKNLRL